MTKHTLFLFLLFPASLSLTHNGSPLASQTSDGFGCDDPHMSVCVCMGVRLLCPQATYTHTRPAVFFAKKDLINIHWFFRFRAEKAGSLVGVCVYVWLNCGVCVWLYSRWFDIRTPINPSLTLIWSLNPLTSSDCSGYAHRYDIFRFFSGYIDKKGSLELRWEQRETVFEQKKT